MSRIVIVIFIKQFNLYNMKPSVNIVNADVEASQKYHSELQKV
jgi:hypothetical protein